MMSSNKKRLKKNYDVHSLRAFTNNMYFSLKSRALTGFASFLHISWTDFWSSSCSLQKIGCHVGCISISNIVSRQWCRSQTQVDMWEWATSVTSNGPATLTLAPSADTALTMLLFCLFPVSLLFRPLFKYL